MAELFELFILICKNQGKASSFLFSCISNKKKHFNWSNYGSFILQSYLKNLRTVLQLTIWEWRTLVSLWQP